MAPDLSCVRKSARPAKPRSLDLLPSGAWHLAPGAAAVGRRLRCYWPAEQAFFEGHVSSFDAATGLHHIVYDDGDSESLLLAAERFEWVHPCAPAAAPAAPTAPADLAHPPLQDRTPRAGPWHTRRPEASDAAWPAAGDLLWGRVKVRSCSTRLHTAAAFAHALHRGTAGGRRARRCRWRRRRPPRLCGLTFSTTRPAGCSAPTACPSWSTLRR